MDLRENVLECSGRNGNSLLLSVAVEVSNSLNST